MFAVQLTDTLPFANELLDGNTVKNGTFTKSIAVPPPGIGYATDDVNIIVNVPLPSSVGVPFSDQLGLFTVTPP